MEGWRKVLIDGSDGAEFLASDHAQLGCIGCHGGEGGENTKDVAHVGLVADPSERGNNTCTETCHADKAANFVTSVHSTQQGYIELIEQRSGLVFEDHLNIQDGFNQHCGGCHATCGDCHISRPKNVGGGLVSAHKVRREPHMIENCTACHGSRVGDEYRGLNETYVGVSPDVHWLPGGKSCTFCHTGDEMHGDGTAYTHRLEVADMPTCDQSGCHIADLENANQYHQTHYNDMSCQVCHSQTYKGCNGCHVGEGITGSSYPMFKMGRNPIPTLRDPAFVLLRHIPVAEDTYDGWGLADLADYSTVSTWKYASPHNVVLHTARTDVGGGGSCFEACHNTADTTDGFFLRASDLDGLSAAEQQANQHLIVPDGNPFTW